MCSLLCSPTSRCPQELPFHTACTAEVSSRGEARPSTSPFPHGLHAHQCLVGLGSLGEPITCTRKALWVGNASSNRVHFGSSESLLALPPPSLPQVPRADSFFLHPSSPASRGMDSAQMRVVGHQLYKDPVLICLLTALSSRCDE